MPNIVLKYAGEGLEVSQPDTPNFAGILKPRSRLVHANPVAAIAAAIRNPIGSPALRDLAKGRRNAVVVISDLTRLVPNKLILPPLLADLEAAGIARTVNHYSKNDAAMSYTGTIMGNTPVYVNKLYSNADLEILTGFIEPTCGLATQAAGNPSCRTSPVPRRSSSCTVQKLWRTPMSSTSSLKATPSTKQDYRSWNGSGPTSS
ncbi:MAG: lactate racemase domain-containing protein [Spirochaetota bacterium]